MCMDISKEDLLRINKGFQCSYHHHKLKRNFFYVLEGELKVKHDMGETVLGKEEFLEVSPPNKHQFVGMTDVLAIEIVYVKLEDALDDIIREESGGKSVF